MFVIRVIYVCIAVFALVVATLYLSYPKYSEYGQMTTKDIKVAANLTSHWQIASNGWKSVTLDLPDGVKVHYAYDQPVNISMVDGPMYSKKIRFSNSEYSVLERAVWFNQSIHTCFTTATVEMRCKGSPQNPNGFVILNLGFNQALKCYMNKTENNYAVSFKDQQCDGKKNGGNFFDKGTRKSEYWQREVQSSVALNNVQDLDLDIKVKFHVPEFSVPSAQVCASQKCIIERGQSDYVSLVLQSGTQSSPAVGVSFKVQYEPIYRAFYILWELFYLLICAVALFSVNPWTWVLYLAFGCFNPILIMIRMKYRARNQRQRDLKTEMKALNPADQV
ncbi:hypothetical protein MP228_012126 [Amoeboaphelidium protococcarum]|nr:hypothetical protein MP228_012126 [Amoeboaphelidium protococcarum]